MNKKMPCNQYGVDCRAEQNMSRRGLPTVYHLKGLIH
jgi:hypothetical protein